MPCFILQYYTFNFINYIFTTIFMVYFLKKTNSEHRTLYFSKPPFLKRTLALTLCEYLRKNLGILCLLTKSAFQTMFLFL